MAKPEKACRAEGLCAKATAGAVQVVGDGNALKAKHVKQGDLSDSQDGVHTRRRAEEPVAQESERP